MTHAGLSWVLVVVAILGPGFIRGGYPQFSEAASCLLAAAALLVAPRGMRSHPLIAACMTLWVLWLLWLGLQLAPLPTDVLSQLAPESLKAWNHLAEIDVVQQARISVFPEAGLRFFIVSLGLLCIWKTLQQLVSVDPYAARRTLLAIAIGGFVQALFGTLTHFNVWHFPVLEPSGRAHHAVAHGTFANRNHFAAVLVIASAATLALMLSVRDTSRGRGSFIMDQLNKPTLIYRVMLFVLLVAVVLSQSRMGNVTLGVGMAVFALFWLISTRTMRSFVITAAIFTSIAVVDILLISERFGLDRVVQRIEATDIDGDSRSVLRQIAMDAINAYTPLGSGLGTFARLETQFDPTIAGAPLVYAHNDHLQLILEAGWVGYGILALLLLLHMGHAARLLGSRRALHRALAAGAMMVCTAALLHATVEFIFYTPGWRVLFVAFLGTLIGVRPPAMASTTRES